LTKKIKYLENQLQRERAETSLATDQFKKLIDEKFDKFFDLIETKMTAALNEKLTSLADILSECVSARNLHVQNWVNSIPEDLNCEIMNSHLN